MRQKKILLACAICLLCACTTPHTNAFASFNENDYDHAIVLTYLKDMRAASDNYYNDYYTVAPQIDYYSTDIQRINKSGSKAFISFITLPYLGAHNTVGKDRITFVVDATSNIELYAFEHLCSYDLPDFLKDLEREQQ